MFVRLLIGINRGEVREMKYADARRLIASGHAELPEAPVAAQAAENPAPAAAPHKKKKNR